MNATVSDHVVVKAPPGTLVRDLLKKAMRKLAWKSFGILVHGGFYRIVASLYSRIIEERTADGTVRRAGGTVQDGRITVLALTPDYHRKDLEILAATGRIRILQLQEKWLTRLLYQFYPPDVQMRNEPWYFMVPKSGEPSYAAKQAYREFLSHFLPLLYPIFGVQCVVSYHVHFLADHDWGAVSDRLGYPYVVLFREGFYGAKHQRDDTGQRLKNLQPYEFEGTHVVVHSEVVRQLLIDSEFIDPAKVTTLGAVRMDEFVRRVPLKENREGKSNSVVFFPFVVGYKTKDRLYPTFRDAHVAMAEFAMEHPEIDVLFKPKGPRRVYEGWKRDADRAFADGGIDPSKIPNLTIRFDLDAHEVIFDSAVVCGAQSTTVLEAGITGKPVILCNMGMLGEADFEIYHRLIEYLDCFDVAESGEHLKELILHRLDDRRVAPETLKKRQDAFELHVSNLKADATDRYVELLETVVATRS